MIVFWKVRTFLSNYFSLRNLTCERNSGYSKYITMSRTIMTKGTEKKQCKDFENERGAFKSESIATLDHFSKT